MAETSKERPKFSLTIPENNLAIPNPESLLSFILETTTPTKLKRFQRDFYKNVEANKTQGIVASRQVGKTHGLAGIAYSWGIIYPEQRIQIVSTGEEHAKEILNRVRWYFKNSRLKDQLEFEKDSATEIQLRHNGTRIVSLPSNPDTLAGYSNHLLIVDEVAKIRHWDEMRSAIFPTVAQTAGTMILSSSFKGKNHWWDIAMDPLWNVKVYPWWVNPSPIIDEFRRNLPAAQFAEEFECIPIDEFHSLFPLELIEQLTIDHCEEFFF